MNIPSKKCGVLSWSQGGGRGKRETRTHAPILVPSSEKHYLIPIFSGSGKATLISLEWKEQKNGHLKGEKGQESGWGTGEWKTWAFVGEGRGDESIWRAQWRMCLRRK